MRCSRCKTAFFVANPEASQQEALDEVVAEATDPGGAVGPGTTQDLFEAGGADLGDSVAGGNDAVTGDDDDELWEFEDAVPGPEFTRAPEPPPSPAPAAAPAETPAATVPLPAPAPPPVPAPVETPSSALTESSDDDFELEDNLAGLDLAETLDEVAAADAPTADTLVSEEAGLDPMAVPDPTEIAATVSDAAMEDEVEGLGGMGAPEDWDFLGESSESMAEAATFTDEAQPPLQAPDTDIFAKRDSEQPIGEPIAAAVMAEPPAHSKKARPSRGWQRPSLVPSANTMGWVLAGVLLMYGFSQALLPSVPATVSATEPRSFDLALGEARQVTGRFIDNAWAGPVFVVEGMYEPMKTPRGPTVLRLRWLDASGQPIDEEVESVAGDSLDQSELRELRPAVAAALLAGTGPDFRHGGAFSLVPGGVPKAAADFDLVLETAPALVIPLNDTGDANGEAG